jgi:hypothetical protein
MSLVPLVERLVWNLEKLLAENNDQFYHLLVLFKFLFDLKAIGQVDHQSRNSFREQKGFFSCS